MEIVIIGAGMAGLSCARRLTKAGLRPRILDKGRGLGGRIATRRTRAGHPFDHGAQFITARDPAFQTLLEEAAQAGAVGRWETGATHPRFVGTPAMTALPKFLGAPLQITLESEVSRLTRGPKRWDIATDRGTLEADILVSTAPAPQTLRLLGDGSDLAQDLAAVSYDPCLTLMAAVSGDLPDLPALTQTPENPLSLIARNETKPGRAPETALVLHASPEWSRAHLELEKDEIARDMTALVCRRLDLDPERITYSAGHRWRFAQVAQPLGRPYARDGAGSLYAGGDWCLGPRVEAAWQSGLAIAEDIIAGLART
ncbi:MAG: FAD-dependent oxidoreductase [Sulfitobacter sp.]|nr:FAD-dependent oxidoreductase [Sulfitobacter sp.]